MFFLGVVGLIQEKLSVVTLILCDDDEKNLYFVSNWNVLCM